MRTKDQSSVVEPLAVDLFNTGKQILSHLGGFFARKRPPQILIAFLNSCTRCFDVFTTTHSHKIVNCTSLFILTSRDR